MRCELALEILQGAGADAAQRATAAAHVARCVDCRRASQAATLLATERARPPPAQPSDAFERAVRNAAARSRAERPRRGFWLGAGCGAAVAASIAVAVFLVRPATLPSPTLAIPEVTFAVNEVRSISVAVETPEPLIAAEIRVSLSGAIDLDGYAAQRELRWTTDLDRGTNQLTLPVIARDASGGQILVEVLHGTKRRTFVVDVHASAPSAPI